MSVHMCRLVLAGILLMSCAGYMQAQTPISLYNSFSGLVNYTVIGGSLRTSSNAVNACAVGASGSSTLNVPVGSTIVGAYLYWAGSGSTSDYTVNLDAQVYTAPVSRQFTAPNPANGNMMFSGFADVTAYVAGKGNGSYTFSGLTVNTANPWCSSQNVCAGWGMVVIYQNANELRHTINVYDGFEAFYGSEIIFNPNNFYVPYSHVDGKMTHITWEGDLENSAALNGFSENLGFDGQIQTDAVNPVNNQFNSVSNALTPDTTWGVDIDTYDVTNYLHSGDTVATSVYSSGGDAVWLSCEVISVSDTSNSDMSITKTHTVLSGAYSGGVIAGGQIQYTLTAANNGPDTTGTVTVRDSLPSGAQFISFTGSGWIVDSTAKPVYKFTHAGTHAPNAVIPSIAITAYVTANYITSTAGLTMYNTATVSSPQFDRRPWNNTATDSVTMYTPLFLTSTKKYTDVSVNGTYPVVNDTLQYTIKVTNTGNYAVSSGNANPISIVDSLPSDYTILSIVRGAGTFDNTGKTITFAPITALALNGSDSVIYRVKAGPTFTGDNLFINRAHIAASTVNQLVKDTAAPSPVLSLTKYFDAGKSKNGDTTQYHIIVKNLSVINSSLGTMSYDTLYGTGYTFVAGSQTASSGTTIAYAALTGTQGRLTWTIGTLIPGAADTLNFKILINTATTTIRDTAFVVNSERFRTASNGTLQYISANHTGVITGPAVILPADTIYYTLTDEDLNTSAATVQTLKCIVIDSITVKGSHERDSVAFTETGVNTGIFTGKIISKYGTSAGTNFNNTTINVQPNDTIIVLYTDALDSANNANRIRSWKTGVNAGNTGTLIGTSTIYSGNLISYTLSDADLNRNPSVAEKYILADTNKVTGEVENVTFTETGINTGVFTGNIPTVYGTTAGTNNSGAFNVKNGDSLRITYFDAVTTSGASAIISWTTKVLGGYTAILAATAQIYPSNSIQVVVTDKDLNKNSSAAESYTVRDSDKVTNQYQDIAITERSANDSVFIGYVNTRYGVITGANNIGYIYVQQGDSLRVSYLDTMQTNGSAGSLLTAMTHVLGGYPGTLTVNKTSIYPGDSVLIAVSDTDLNRNASLIESYSVIDSNIATHEWETVTVKETAANTGIFQGYAHTKFGATAGTNNDGIFNVKTGDSLVVTYVDTVTTNGAPGLTLKAGTGIKGGTTATLTGTPSILPGTTILDTLKDADLNRNASLAEIYTLRDTSKNGQIDTVTFTETGVNTGIFTASVPTTFGVTKGSNGKNVTFKAQAGDTITLAYYDTLQTNGGSAWLFTRTVVAGYHTALLSVTPSMLPGASSIDTVFDADLNKNLTVAESYMFRDTSRNGQIDTVTFTETGVNTGIFTASVPTVFGTTKGANGKNVTFKAQAGDTLYLFYTDTLAANGGPGAAMVGKTAIIGGHTAQLTGSISIVPGVSALDTLVDLDLNRNAGAAETYMLRDTSKNGQVDTVTFTETGVNTGVFTASVPTVFGTTKGANGKNATFNAQAGDTLYLFYTDTLAANGGPGAALVTKTAVLGGYAAQLKGSTSVVPGLAILDTIVDLDLNRNISAAEIYTFRDTSSNGQIDTVTFTETGVNTGIFTATIPTAYGKTKGTNGKNVTFNAAGGDTVCIIYKDTMTTNGGPGAILQFKCGVVNPLMTLIKSVDKSHGKPGDTLTYSMTYKNTGTANATFVTLTDPSPNNTTYVANSVTINGTAQTDAADGDETTYSGGMLQINIGTVTPGQTGTIIFKVVIQ